MERTAKKYKNLNISRTKRAFQIKQKPFFIVFEGLSFNEKITKQFSFFTLKTSIYTLLKKENFHNALILLYTLLKKSKYFYFGFDQVQINHKRRTLINCSFGSLDKFVSITSALFKFCFTLQQWQQCKKKGTVDSTFKLQAHNGWIQF